jgi:hypothetical protein
MPLVALRIFWCRLWAATPRFTLMMCSFNLVGY